MKRLFCFVFVFAVLEGVADGQSLKQPDVPAPSLKLIKNPKYHSTKHSSTMGLFDWNFALGYIDKSANVTQTGYQPQTITSAGQYGMFHLQESILSNYFLAKKYHRNKRFKIGFQNTFDLGLKGGQANDETSNYSAPTVTSGAPIDFFFNYQAGIATAFRVMDKMDIGYTYYLYVQSIFAPQTKQYSKFRFKYGQFMAEYSTGGMSAVELKYVRSRKLYIGLSYTKNNQNLVNANLSKSAIDTKWYQLSIGRIF